LATGIGLLELLEELLELLLELLELLLRDGT
jgi:hypothetical protein